MLSKLVRSKRGSFSFSSKVLDVRGPRVVVHGEGFKEMKRLGVDQDLARFVDAPCTSWSETTETLLPSNHSRATAQIKS